MPRNLRGRSVSQPDENLYPVEAPSTLRPYSMLLYKRGARRREVREVFFDNLEQVIEGLKSAERLGFPYKLEHYDRILEANEETDETTPEWRLTLYDHWEDR